MCMCGEDSFGPTKEFWEALRKKREEQYELFPQEVVRWQLMREGLIDENDSLPLIRG